MNAANFFLERIEESRNMPNTQVTTQHTLLDTASLQLVKTADVSEELLSSFKIGSAVRGRTIPPLVSALKEASPPTETLVMFVFLGTKWTTVNTSGPVSQNLLPYLAKKHTPVSLLYTILPFG